MNYKLIFFTNQNRKYRFLICIFFTLSLFSWGQSLTHNNSAELYIDAVVPGTLLASLEQNFVIDNVLYNEQKQNFTVRIFLPQKKYAAFDSLQLPYSIVSDHDSKYTVTLANSYADMVANWDKYPSYNTYLAMMDTFQSRWPQWCSIENVLSTTPGGHKILAAHIGNFTSFNTEIDRPTFLYSSTMHGDEVGGFYLMLRLIYHLLSNATTNPQVENILNNVDLWIIPLINPDGTYYTHNNTIGTSPTSTRSNHNGEDINRSFPQLAHLMSGGNSNGNYEPEVQAMMDFFNTHDVVMSANLHGGAEVFNYPWDAYTTTQRPHPDSDWFAYIGHNFANSCHVQNSNYFTGCHNGITEGGDWYVITGSQQDWANYAAYCKEVTIEVEDNKVVQNSQLNTLWSYTKQAMLDYIEECLYGLHGRITDSITGEPLAARIFIQNHDVDHSETFSFLPTGYYHRPIKEGTYTVQYSSEGYLPKTYTLNVTDGATTIKNVQLVSLTQSAASVEPPICRIYPNPTYNEIIIEAPKLNLTAEFRNITGKILYRTSLQNFNKIDIEKWVNGIYVLTIMENEKIVKIQKIVKIDN